MRLNSAMKKGIIPFYTLTLAIMCLGFCFGLYRNWEHQLKTTKITLSHDAALTSTFIDNALISTEKSLDLANIQLAARLRSGQHDEATAHHILTTALRNFMLFNASQLYGLMFIVDDQGLLLARTGEYPARIIDFSDRYYYQDLRDHPHKPYTIGPVIKAKMTGKYVFHMAVPILDTQSRFHGVLVQQLQIDDLCDLLGRNYFGLADHIVMHHPTQGLSFVYPPPAKHAIPIKIDVIAQAITKSELKTGAILLDNGSIPLLGASLVGFATSPTFGFVTSATMSMKAFIKIYLVNSMLLCIYFAFSILLVSFLLWGLHSQYIALEKMESIVHNHLKEAEPTMLRVKNAGRAHYRIFKEDRNM